MLLSNISNSNIKQTNLYPNFNDTTIPVSKFTRKTPFLKSDYVSFKSLSIRGKEKSFEKIHQGLRELLHRDDLSIQEAATIIRRYREIYENTGGKQYIVTLFNQVKGDFGQCV